MKKFLRVHKRTFFFAAVGFACLAFLLVFTELPWVLSKPIMVQENIKASPVIVVLYSGYGDVVENGLDRYSLQRLQKAVRLWKRGFASFLIFSGGCADRRGNGHPGAQRMALEAGNRGVPREKIIVEHGSKDTRHNVLNSSSILRERGWDALILVTDDFHMKRAANLFEEEGFRIYPAPVAWQPRGEWKANLQYLRLFGYELAARVAYILLSEKQMDALINFLRPSGG
jgi:uncharacterized SAM-binding protein YcdF (DUF218 family)